MRIFYSILWQFYLFFETLLAVIRILEFYIWLVLVRVDCLQNSLEYFLRYRRGYQDKVQDEV